MALLPNATQIPAQRVPLTGTKDMPAYTTREWYRFFDAMHTYMPTPVAFTPAFTPITNVTILTPGTCFSNQMGSVINLTGSFILDPTTTGNTVFRMTPPVLDGLAVTVAAGMFITTAAGASDVGSITLTAGLLEFRLNAASAATATYVFNANYQIA